MSMQILCSVVFAHRFDVVRAGVRRIVSLSPSMELVADVATGPQTIDYSRTLEPDVVVIDELVPHISSAEIARILVGEVPRSRLLLWADQVAADSIRQAMQAGFHGVITPDVSASELVHLIEAASRMEPAMSASALAVLSKAGTAPVAENIRHDFTNREREIVRMVVQGLTSQQIGKELFISARTVETHRARIMDKIGVKKTAGMVRFALDHPALFEIADSAV